MGGRGATSSINTKYKKMIEEWKQAERDTLKPQKGFFSKTGDELSEAYHNINEARGIAQDKYYNLMSKLNNDKKTKESKMLIFNDIQKTISYTKNNTRVELLNSYAGEKDGGKVYVNVKNVAPYHNDIIKQEQFVDPRKALDYAYSEIKKIK